MFKKYLEWVTKEKKAEGLWTLDKNDLKKYKKLELKQVPDWADNITNSLFVKMKGKKVSDILKNSLPDSNEFRAVLLSNGNFYTCEANSPYTHSSILGYIIFNGEPNDISEEDIKQWWMKSPKSFICLHGSKKNPRILGISESYMSNVEFNNIKHPYKFDSLAKKILGTKLILKNFYDLIKD